MLNDIKKHRKQLQNGLVDLQKKVFCFPNGLKDYLDKKLENKPLFINKVFNGSSILENKEEYIEWAIGWPQGIENEFLSFCAGATVNTKVSRSCVFEPVQWGYHDR